MEVFVLLGLLAVVGAALFHNSNKCEGHGHE